jgi:xanthine dehydrogenase small subunit
MTKFILNNQIVETDLPKGETVLDFVRYHKNLKGTKIGCREGDCGACTILVGELKDDAVKYRSMTSCLMPLANANGKHIVTVEGINKQGDELTEVQQAMVDQSGTQCGFCTVGFVMSLTGFAIDETAKTNESAISAIDGNICRCTGYKSIERACEVVVGGRWSAVAEENLETAINRGIVPAYFSDIKNRLKALKAALANKSSEQENHTQTHAAKFGVEDKYDSENPQSAIRNPQFFIAGGTDLYVQRPEEMVYASAENLFDNADLRFVRENGESVEIGASATVTDLLVSPVMQNLFPNLYKHLKLVSSTPIRNMATIAGNFVNASPIGDMTAWFLALDATVILKGGNPRVSKGAEERELPLRELYFGYKTLAKADEEFITKIRFRKNFTHFNFEKVSKRTFLDISSVNSAVSLKVENGKISEAHASAGGVAPVPLYLKNTSAFLRGKEINDATISQAIDVLQSEISPISDVRGSVEYKRLLAQQLFTAHFVELFDYQLNG